ncbi:hypothetical protein GGI11_003889 [Coemansia sp. RSA 2049]|nr:hypothetical protein GGI11_003889 [Coemansia sp. RSA 2049]
MASTPATASSAFLAAVARVPKEKFPATHAANAVFGKLDLVMQRRLPPHLHPLFVRLRAFCVRQAFVLEHRLHINPTFALLLRTRIIPPSVAFVAAAASTIYAVRYLYTHALDLLTNIIGVAYPAYQSILAIEYGGDDDGLSFDDHNSSTATEALGIAAPNLDKKQWLMYWAIYGVLTTADHWAGPILRLFPMYRIAKIGVLVWAQHQKYNGAAWLYDTFVRPLLPPPRRPSVRGYREGGKLLSHEHNRIRAQQTHGLLDDDDKGLFADDYTRTQTNDMVDGKPIVALASLELAPSSSSSSIWGSLAPSSSRGPAVDIFARSAMDIALASALKSS